MNITRQPVTITQTVSAAIPAACPAVWSSAMTAMGTNAAATVTAAASRKISFRFENAWLYVIEDVGKVPSAVLIRRLDAQPMAAPHRAKTCG